MPIAEFVTFAKAEENVAYFTPTDPTMDRELTYNLGIKWAKTIMAAGWNRVTSEPYYYKSSRPISPNDAFENEIPGDARFYEMDKKIENGKEYFLIKMRQDPLKSIKVKR